METTRPLAGLASAFHLRGNRSASGVVLLVGSAVVLVCTVGCSTPASSAPSTTRPADSTSSTGPTLSPADVAGQRATAAYLGMWQNFATAGMTSDWQSPALAQYSTGIALSNMTRGLYADHYNGLVTRGTATHNAHVASANPPASPTTVVITDCSDSTHSGKYYENTGQPANDGPGGRRLINAVVQKQADGTWKVSDFGVKGVGTC